MISVHWHNYIQISTFLHAENFKLWTGIWHKKLEKEWKKPKFQIWEQIMIIIIALINKLVQIRPFWNGSGIRCTTGVRFKSRTSFSQLGDLIKQQALVYVSDFLISISLFVVVFLTVVNNTLNSPKDLGPCYGLPSGN